MRFCPILLVCVLVSRAWASSDDVITDFAGADVNIGERLFLETRFSQFFFANSFGFYNNEIYEFPGDPLMAVLQTTTNSVPGPFAGQAMNCRQCHLVDEEGYGQFGNHTLGNRTYADFARRSPVPNRDDDKTQTPRNSPGLVDALLPRDVPLLLHFDGQFASVHDLIIATLTGRNYGWRPEEYATAVHHIASVIRYDDGTGYLALEARGRRFAVGYPGETAYRNIFSGFTDYRGSYLYDPRTLVANLISPQYRLDMRGNNATDEQILDTIASLIEAYLRNLVFAQATNGVDFVGVGTPRFTGSPYDTFLIKNDLPQLPEPGETSTQYAQRLLQLVTQLPRPKYVTNPADGEFFTHTQSFRFGPVELEGLKIFLADKDSTPESRRTRIGNCATCHTPPAFADFIFHNTGATEEEYDAVHGTGSFQKLSVPGLAMRQANYDAYLPPTPNHPQAAGRFETPPSWSRLDEVDLGLWNVFANPDFPAPQPALRQILPKLLGLSSPRIEGATIRNNHFVITGSDGVPGGTYYVLASINPQSPPTDWAIIATNKFDHRGRFNFTKPGNPDSPQEFYRLSLVLPSDAEVLPRMIALFKTPTVRDLGHSNPYLHTGRMNSIEDVIDFYRKFSNKARHDAVRNAAPELSDISLSDSAVAPLAAFLRSLNEDYTD